MVVIIFRLICKVIYVYFGLDFCRSIVLDFLWASQERQVLMVCIWRDTTLPKSARMTSAQASDDVGSNMEPTSSLDWADLNADFQTVISRNLQNISTYLFFSAERMLRIIIIQNSRLIQAWFPITIDEVLIDQFCIYYDWWRRLQPTTSVSTVWYLVVLRPKQLSGILSPPARI